MYYHQAKESLNHHGLLQRISDLNEINEMAKKEVVIADIANEWIYIYLIFITQLIE